jgi:hypothetical protein
VTTYYREPRPARKIPTREQMQATLQTEAFRRGISWGKHGIFRGKLCIDPTEEGVVEIIRNLIEFAIEGHLTEEQLRQDVGIIVGFVSQHPSMF